MYITYAELRSFYFKENTGSVIYNKVIEYINYRNYRRRVRKLDIEMVMGYIYITKNKLEASGISEFELEGINIEHVFYYPKKLKNYNYSFITPELDFTFYREGVDFYLSLTPIKNKKENCIILTPKARNRIISKFLKNF